MMYRTGRFAVLAFGLMFLVGACSSSQPSRSGAKYKSHHGVTALKPDKAHPVGPIKKVAIIDLREAVPSEVTVGDQHVCPLTKLNFSSGTIVKGAGIIVTDHLRYYLAQAGFVVAGRDRVEQATMEVALADGSETLPCNVDTARKVGRLLGVDAVFMGYLMRYEDRVGGSIAVGEPASVAFSVALVDMATGEIAWKAKFDKTQKSLFEDITDYKSFFSGGMVWQSAEKFSALGAESIINALPITPSM